MRSLNLKRVGAVVAGAAMLTSAISGAVLAADVDSRTESPDLYSRSFYLDDAAYDDLRDAINAIDPENDGPAILYIDATKPVREILTTDYTADYRVTIQGTDQGVE